MKLTELIERADAHIAREVTEHLRADDLDELAAVVEYGTDATMVYMATNRGVCIVTYTPGTHEDRRARISGELTAWTEVYGVRLVSAGYAGSDWDVATLYVTNPSITTKAANPVGIKALRELRDEISRLALGWSRTPSTGNPSA